MAIKSEIMIAHRLNTHKDCEQSISWKKAISYDGGSTKG